MKKRVLGIAFCTTMMLVFTLIFGYLSGVLGLAGVASAKKDVATGEVQAGEIGVEFSVIGSDSGAVSDEEKNAVTIAENFIEKSMAGSVLSCEVSADYENKCIVCEVKTGGAAQAAVEGSSEDWDKITELGQACSESWMDGIRTQELKDWDFSVVVLNDLNSDKAILICTDGELIYDCREDLDKQAA